MGFRQQKAYKPGKVLYNKIAALRLTLLFARKQQTTVTI